MEKNAKNGTTTNPRPEKLTNKELNLMKALKLKEKEAKAIESEIKGILEEILIRALNKRIK